MVDNVLFFIISFYLVVSGLTDLKKGNYFFGTISIMVVAFCAIAKFR